jgi:hypothetical protein
MPETETNSSQCFGRGPSGSQHACPTEPDEKGSNAPFSKSTTSNPIWLVLCVLLPPSPYVVGLVHQHVKDEGNMLRSGEWSCGHVVVNALLMPDFCLQQQNHTSRVELAPCNESQLLFC